ncbi:arylsulfatase [Occultella glacieicola]|uniref:Arylsulfatase n=2 Tax=Occultella glacieicola TaxID=2518684 RepID=A0ABY2E537_9MICO|nr:arylsulfatase [Occultella glacieicola]
MADGAVGPGNIVLICVDQWRGDALSVAGHPVVRTPHLDALARSGTRFTSAYSATPTCTPARAALFTGQSQERHGRVGYRDGVPFHRAHPVTLAGELSRAGYQTQAIGKMHVYPERSRAGFDDVRLHDGYLHHARRRGANGPAPADDYLTWLHRQDGQAAADYTETGLNCNSVVARPWDKAEHLHPTNWVVSESLDWLDRRDPTVPFFLYMSFHRPHPPYDPPSWAFEQYLAAEPTEPVVGDWTGDLEAFRTDGVHDAFVGRMDPVTHHRARAGYYGHMAHIDVQINRFLEALGEHGLARDTTIVFVSDHGEMMGDHDLYRKGFPYQGSAGIPMLISSPRHPGGVVRDEVVELRDIMPTLLDLAGAPVPDSVDGRSLVPLLEPDSAPPWREVLHGEHTLLKQSLQWLTDGRRKYVWLSGEGLEQFFDLVEDPQETRNLAADPTRAGEVAIWRARLVEALTDREEGYVLDGGLVPGRTPITEFAWVRDLIG